MTFWKRWHLFAVTWRILAAGKPALAYAKKGIEEYLKRLTRGAKVELIYLKAGSSEVVSADLLARSEGTYRIALDERGKAWTTGQLVKMVNAWEMDPGIKTISLLIGASDGHTEELRQKCDQTWALSPLTLQHELALVVLLEQIYRAYSIKRGEPYHR
ncbi:23S rRNA (pseudouridine(1915)-N(3))-methyltransferase RlmH [Akkermansiaceae bacterium]|nr:23S rRNA (pseudouridine(1915)-N(3))-methyltransferase RlmH [Akkermansiaceae bacterium]MDB4287454.1 23S rRNA (pseudouridine(1915)-N(3))-methyltransferase RlmH [bacterium]MDB4144173.1 23S rRNA (pseudouridine(1915)-N(3))-methyltransferase RlmH [Akkermansiaceae bacterium]MDB4377930.1 23S rRNA (pseudouridine(1915)-N(3))-methyltransferase RlmH [Akkermansiaceae bacterium]MDC1206561.1 23S rRNA (pseudouridine(1915)-N(3))-methyltransferase RlmH [Akkermansiaceae bacterium]